MASPIVLTPATSFDLTTLATVKAEIGKPDSDTSEDTRLQRRITAASKSIARACHRRFARQFYRQALMGAGRVILQLGETPIVGGDASVTVNKVTADGSEAITDFSILDAERGWLYRELGWDWTRPLITGRQTSALNIAGPTPAVGFDRHSYVVDFPAGYLLPGDNRTATTIGFIAASKTITDSAGKLPLVVSGDTIVVTGSASNNKTLTVVTRTASVITVAEVLVNESAGASVTLAVRNLDEDLEMICVREAILQWRRDGRDATIVSERVEGVTTTYARPDRGTGLMGDTVSALTPFMRMAA